MGINGVGQAPASNAASATEAKEKAQAGAFEAALKKAAESGDQTALKKACQDFETIFVQMMFKNMRSTVPQDGLLEKSQAESIFEGMLDEEFSKKVAGAGGMGIGDLLFNQLQKKYGPKEDEAEKPSLDIKG